MSSNTPTLKKYRVSVEGNASSHPRLARHRYVTGLTISACLSLGLAACGGAPSPTATSGHARRDSSTKPTVINWLGVANSPAQHAFWASVAAEVHKKYPDITVNLDSVPFGSYFPKLESDVSGGSGVCLAQMQSLRMAQYHALFKPLNSLIKEFHFPLGGYAGSIVKGLSYGRNILNLPFDTGPYLLYYNKTMFGKAHLPVPTDGWSLGTFMHDLSVLKSRGEYGIAVGPAGGNWLPFAASLYGAQPATALGRLTIDSAPMVKTLAWYDSLIHKYHYSPPMPGSSLSNSSYTLDLFTSSDVAMYVGGPWNMPTGKAASSFPKFGIVSMPSTEAGTVPLSVTAGSGFGITRNCRNPVDAFKALSVLIGPEAQRQTGLSGWGYPALSSALAAYYTTTPAGTEGVLTYLSHKDQPRYVSPNWASLEITLSSDSVSLANSGGNASAVLKSVQRTYGS